MKFKDEHHEAYGVAGLRWPPNLNEFDMIDPEGMSERKLEVAIFLHQRFPQDPSGGPSFADINHSWGHLLGKLDQPRNAWTHMVPCLTEKSAILYRPEKVDSSTGAIIRLLSGEELMSIIGWSSGMSVGQVADGTPLCEENSLLTNLAGNAFSGYSVAPILMVGLALAGGEEADFPAPHHRPADDLTTVHGSDEETLTS